jgi:hypothetical protein
MMIENGRVSYQVNDHLFGEAFYDERLDHENIYPYVLVEKGETVAVLPGSIK